MQKKFLLIRTDRIGDLISITPSISVLRKNFPHAYIAVLVSAYAADVIKNNPEIDEIITVKSFFKTLAEIRAKKFDVAIIFFLNTFVAWLTFLARISVRIGPVSKIWAVLLTKRIRQHRSKDLKHEAEYNLDLLKPLFVYYHPAKPKIYVPRKDDIKAKDYLQEKFGIGRRDITVMVHPGSKGSAARWPLPNYAMLVREIMAKHPEVKVMLTGAAAEQELLTETAGLCKPFKPLVLTDDITLSQFIAVINQCKIFISNSTGPLHIATALGKKTLSFYPNTKGCLPERWAPYGKGHAVLTPHDERLCPVNEKGCTPECMALITPQRAFENFERLLHSIHTAP
ncbi:Glycosyl transferase family [Elusimicrobium minutum Pei191]|uniref:Glycosyl transferase family n=1 Tax=Elusimicrobium minutum (strain Pei191) TaxID=445932 RepID=B2KC54_ELUMP|nr:glycosyltransferase family 9 protein [Elusimicrobium minutum]ACC98181.1 Glycosyl transferase family [Elusimicrobium minutum Pei191]